MNEKFIKGAIVAIIVLLCALIVLVGILLYKIDDRLFFMEYHLNDMKFTLGHIEDNLAEFLRGYRKINPQAVMY